MNLIMPIKKNQWNNQKKYYWKHRNKILINTKKYYKKNRTKINAQHKIYLSLNKKKIIERRKKYYTNNRKNNIISNLQTLCIPCHVKKEWIVWKYTHTRKNKYNKLK